MNSNIKKIHNLQTITEKTMRGNEQRFHAITKFSSSNMLAEDLDRNGITVLKNIFNIKQIKKAKIALDDIYINSTPSRDTFQNSIGNNFRGDNKKEYWIRPEEDDIIVMEGWMPHAPNNAPKSTIDRVVLAGNVGFELIKKEKSLL